MTTEYQVGRLFDDERGLVAVYSTGPKHLTFVSIDIPLRVCQPKPLPARRNPVAKYMDQFNRAKRLTNKRVYQRRPKHKSVDSQ